MKLRLIASAVACGMAWSVPASAAPIVWEASGTLTHLAPARPFVEPLPDFLVLGLPWSMTFEVDPSVEGMPVCTGGQAIVYDNAVQHTRLTLGDYAYRHGPADMFLNFFLPHGRCDLEGGAIDFYWPGNGWTSEGDAPLLTAFAIARAGGSLLFQAGEFGGQFGGSFVPEAVPMTAMPEPATVLLLGSGLAAAAWRRRRRV